MHGIRFAAPGDEHVILGLIRELAEYEHALDEVIATPELLAEWLFERKTCECLILSTGGEDVGMALFFHNFSTWLGRGGIYLEDLYVKPEHRGKGFGTALLAKLAQIALERGCGRLEWACLDWNTPSIEFYKALGAQTMDEWTVYRLTGDTLEAMARR
ncbi:MAG: GNAT family N-acetyltransferase [Coriobacteriales bacterium]